MPENGKPEKDEADAKADLMVVLDSVERLDTTAIEKEITELEARVERLRRLLAVRRGLKPRSGKRGRKRPAPETVA